MFQGEKMLRTGSFLIGYKLQILILTTALILTGCNLPISRAAPTEIPPLAFPTSQPTNPPALLTPTPNILPPTTAPAEPSTAIPPTTGPPTTVPPTVQVQPTTIPGAVRISFDAGATAGIAQGDIRPGQVLNFVIGAAQAQPLIISTDSPNHDVTFSVVGLKDGKTLLDPSQRLSSWQTMLTVTQDYLVQLMGAGSQENFTLNVNTPARINFDPGKDTTLIMGSTPGGWDVSYVLRASAGQRMDLNLYAPDGNAVLAIYGYQDGQPYLRYVAELTTFGLELPATQDYIIQVVPRAGQVANYSLGITIK
jgi:hypothetical protein